jgi:phage portal protein BeeE
MEFQQLITNSTYAIYKTFKVPLPLIETKVQTYNNYTEGQAQLYDNASEPVVTEIIMQLRKILNDPTIELDIESLPISAKIKSYDIAKRQSDAGIFTINEIRATLGLEPLEGGNILI